MEPVLMTNTPFLPDASSRGSGSSTTARRPAKLGIRQRVVHFGAILEWWASGLSWSLSSRLSSLSQSLSRSRVLLVLRVLLRPLLWLLRPLWKLVQWFLRRVVFRLAVLVAVAWLTSRLL